MKRRVARILIWIGVLAWVPYIVMHALSIEVGVAPFLTVHLLGVIPGAVLNYTERRQASHENQPNESR